MATILITYDLNKPGQDYKAVHEAIKKFPGWAHLMDSTWAVSGVGLTPYSVSDTLRAVMDKSTSLFCVDITGQARQGWLDKDMWEWFDKAA
ncbi:hypothetical protein LEP48_01310 [Isoptericola sp. NEAU-Y5]|uniref:SinR family protein n=1 Tax=Isoptericola luteus TaxID=2879484 RepID=A0ABS7ZAR8_9MICO|nr:hypothetical protein [Isoptericola sp. NEAU-Y5]MCA5891988.1 hypothetical protein [Isoptericola sp. NEAU-Y5]